MKGNLVLIEMLGLMVVCSVASGKSAYDHPTTQEHILADSKHAIVQRMNQWQIPGMSAGIVCKPYGVGAERSKPVMVPS
jgi:hypothetical protein